VRARSRPLRAIVLVLPALAALPWSFSAPSASSAVKSPSEDAYRANNLGVALLEQFDYPAAAEAFRRALAADAGLGLARLNLAIALYNARDLEGAQREARLATQALPDRPHPHYVLGLVAKAENRTEDAIASFQRVAEMDPGDVGANVNLGQMYMQVRRYPDAIAVFRRAVAAEPYSQTAVYNLGIALTRAGQRAEGEQVMERFKALRDSGYRTVLGQNYLEQGRYAEALSSTGAEADLVSRDTPAARFAEASADALPAELRASSGASQLALADLDADGDLDLVVAGTAGLRVWRNDKGRFADAGALAGGPYLAVVAGDFDNDGRADLLALGAERLALFRQEGPLRFQDVTAAAGLGAPAPGTRALAFSDCDHDGDLDVVAGRLWRNNGNGTFADVTAAAGLDRDAPPVALVPTDFDNRRDVDLLLAPASAPVRLYRNMRDGTFRDVAAEVGLRDRAGAVAAGDVNKDEYTDFYLGGADGPGVVALSDGRGRFGASAAPATLTGARAAQFLDYDADGLLDLLALTGGGPRLLRNVGGSWVDVGTAALAGIGGEDGRALASGDLDGDGDTDVLVLGSGGVTLLRNDGGGRKHTVRVRLTAQVSNRSSVGAKVEARAGSLRQKLETYAASPAPAPADVVFGLGPRAAADAVRVLWPAGILQTETAMAAADGRPAAAGAPLLGATTITELDRKPSSCPYLYAWNGERFAFVTDFMGGGEMGYRHENGAFNHPDPDEYVRLAPDQLRPRDGRLELRVTNELEEVLYVDRLRLLAVDHPAADEVHPYEGLVGARGGRPFRLFAAAEPRPVARAWDDHGHDVTDRLARTDRTYPDDFRTLSIRGYAEEHGLVLDLGAGSDDVLLLLTGWTDYAFSSDNVAAQQRGLAMRPPSLQVKDGDGRWQTVIEEVGIPVGRPQTLVADLRGLWRGPSRQVRVLTNMRIYWDRAQVARAGASADLVTSTLEPASADLRWRGFSAEETPDGREPFGYRYERVAAHSPWKVFPGRYTREGDVRELVTASDDMFVVSRPGDEIAVAFDARALPPLRAGFARTWLLYSDGYSKEMDVNSASPDAVEPLPFHAMSRYPYAAPEAYPLTAERRAYLERYNTRVVARPLPPLEVAAAAAAR
jgi:tetratricopeptide (TPR) repeat protein